MSKETTNYAVSFPFFSILGLIFITLKLTGYISWSWLWVLAPFWMPITLILLVFLLFLLGGMVVIFFNTLFNNRR